MGITTVGALMFVYLIVNRENGKYYVGKTVSTNLKKYLQDKCWDATHRPHLRSHLYAAIRKHGKYAFTIHPLISALTTNQQLCDWETFFIALFNSRNPEVGYNICKGGEGFTGPHSEESKAQIRAALIGRPQSPGLVRKRVDSLVAGGKLKGRKSPMKGKQHSAEANEANRVAHLGKTSARKGKRVSPETLERMRHAAIRHYAAHPEARNKISDSLKKYHMDNPDANRLSHIGQRPWNKRDY